MAQRKSCCPIALLFFMELNVTRITIRKESKMNLLHATVSHPTFGQGEIIETGEDVICVSFSEPFGKKKFPFPGSFDQHLTLENESLSAEMIAFLKQNHIEITALQQRAERADRIAQCRANSIERANELTKVKKKKK